MRDKRILIISSIIELYNVYKELNWRTSRRASFRKCVLISAKFCKLCLAFYSFSQVILFKRISANYIYIMKLAMSLTRTLAVFVPYSLSYGMVKTKGTLEKLVGVPEHCQVMD